MTESLEIEMDMSETVPIAPPRQSRRKSSPDVSARSEQSEVALWSSESEEGLLSSIMIDPAELAIARSVGVRPECFFHSGNAAIYKTLCDLADRGQPTDCATLLSELNVRKELDRAGGSQNVVRIGGVSPTTARARYDSERVVELHRLRRIKSSAERTLEAVRTYSGEGVDELVRRHQQEIESIDSVSARDWPAAVSARTFCDSAMSEPPELIRGVLFEGGTMMLSGPSKARKTYTMLHLAHALSTGSGWLGFECGKVPVIFVNLELQAFAVQARLKAIGAASGAERSDALRILNLRGWLVDLPSLRRNLPRLIRATGARALILDPHYKVSSASGIEENSNDAQAAFLYELEALVCSEGAALILAHHFSKGNSADKKAIDRASGGGALARWPDVVATMTEHEAVDCVTIEFALRNFAPVPPFVARWTYPLWTRDGSLDPLKLKRPAGRREEHSPQEVLQKLRDGMTVKEWESVAGVSGTTFRRKRDTLLSQGLIRQSGGCYYRNEPIAP